MLTKDFQKAAHIIDTIKTNGYEAYFVGGCVRDFLLHREIKDIDIASSAPPQIIQQLFPKVIPVGVEHGTVIVRHNSVSYEVTTFRHDGTYTDQRHPDKVSFQQTIEEDLKRRDFTINAMAMDKFGEIIDLHNGQQDLQQNMIRAVGCAEQRFTEDPLRMIRALRFTSQLGFTIEETTLSVMKQLHKKVTTVAIERLTTELTKLFQGEHLLLAISNMIDSNIDTAIPIFRKNESLLNKMPQHVTAFHSFAEVIAYFHYMDHSIEIIEWVKSFKCSNKVQQYARNLVDALHHYKENEIDEWLLYRLNDENIKSFIHLLHMLFPNITYDINDLMTRKNKLQIQSKNELVIDGNDIIKMFPNASRGRWISKLMTAIEKEVIYNRLENDKNAIKEWIKCHPPEIN